MNSGFLWYIPSEAQPGHRGDAVVAAHNSLETLTGHALALEETGGTALFSVPGEDGLTPSPSPPDRPHGRRHSSG